MLCNSIYFCIRITSVRDVHMINFITDGRTLSSLYQRNVTTAGVWLVGTKQSCQLLGYSKSFLASFPSAKFSNNTVLPTASFRLHVQAYGALLPHVLHGSQELT